MKISIKILLLLLFPIVGMAQSGKVDSLRKVLKNAHTDSARYFVSLLIGREEINRDTSLYYFDEAFHIAKKSRQALAEASALSGKSYLFTYLGKFPESLQCIQQALALAEDPQNENTTWQTSETSLSEVGERLKPTPHKNRLQVLSDIHYSLSGLMGATNNTDQQIIQLKVTKQFAVETGQQALVGAVDSYLGYIYLGLHRLDSALVFELNAESIFEKYERRNSNAKKYHGEIFGDLGNIYLEKGNKNLALQYFHKEIDASIKAENIALAAYAYKDLARFYLGEKEKDSSLYYAKKNLEILHSMGAKDLGDAYETLYKSYQLAEKTDSAYKYQGLALAAKDSSFTATSKNLADFQKLSFQAQLHAQDLEKEKETIKTRTRTYALVAGIVIFMLIAGIFYRNNRQKQKANYLLHEQKEEIKAQRDSLDEALQELKNTQSQLVQREKMASLGELTAGIAHEIQNPLNFVNNFSEVSAELVDEMDEELDKGDVAEAKAISADIKQNLEKIRHHGKRADFIVKGMLEHSRTSTGERQETNINVLTDEFLKLSYHGLRAKDKSFNAELVTNFDPNLPEVKVAQQDLGRVLINLFGNAFYAVNQKAKTAGADYKPTVEVSTARRNGSILVSVKDNGMGVPDAIKDKIMQPFFTTKPTGEGTGLGLSLSYDIVVKGHGGRIDVNSMVDQGSEFIVILPFQ